MDGEKPPSRGHRAKEGVRGPGPNEDEHSVRVAGQQPLGIIRVGAFHGAGRHTS